MKMPTKRCACGFSRCRRSTIRRLFSACRRRSRSREDIGKTRVVPIVIDGASHEFVIPVAARPKMVQIDPQGWLIKDLDFEKDGRRKPVSARARRRAFWAGSMPRGHWYKAAKDKPQVAKALAAAWKREKTDRGQREMCEILGNGDEIFRAALIEAAKAPEARVRVAAIAGLARLSRDDTAEAVLRAAWTNPKEAYGAPPGRACVGWSPGRSKTPTSCLPMRSHDPADHHSIAATALEILLQNPGAKSRELAALYSKYGQPDCAAIRGHQGVPSARQG